MLHYETIIPEARGLLERLMSAPELTEFRLVGGTALSLLTGHRISDDIDLFVDGYDSFNQKDIKKALIGVCNSDQKIKISSGTLFSVTGYFISNNGVRVKVDVMNFDSDKFIFPAIEEDSIRLASLEDISAMKLNAITHRKERKDFIDIHQLQKGLTLGEMIGFYKKRFEYFDEKDVIDHLAQIDKADNTPMPRLLNPIDWVKIKSDIKQSFSKYMNP